MRPHIALVAILLPAAAFAQDAEPQRFVDGPGAGMFRSTEVSREGDTVVYELGPSLPNASPVPDDLAEPIRNLIAAQKTGDYSSVSSLFAASPTFDFCRGFGNCQQLASPDVFGLSEPLEANTPYSLRDGRIRIEWMAGDRVKHQSWLTFDHGKLINARTAGAVIQVQTTTEVVPANG